MSAAIFYSGEGDATSSAQKRGKFQCIRVGSPWTSARDVAAFFSATLRCAVAQASTRRPARPLHYFRHYPVSNQAVLTSSSRFLRYMCNDFVGIRQIFPMFQYFENTRLLESYHPSEDSDSLVLLRIVIPPCHLPHFVSIRT